MTRLRVWLGHDGYRDPDDNLTLLLGGAYARAVSVADDDVRVMGVVFGDTKDGGQFHTLVPDGETPAAFGSDERYPEAEMNRQAAGNHAFFRQYAVAAIHELSPDWQILDTLADDAGGLRAWNFDASSASEISGAARAIADDIAEAAGLGLDAEGNALRLVVYSAGGGANVAAEAIGYLLNQGYTEADLLPYFAVVQHGNNWATNYEAAARELTRDFTIAISNQNYAEYADGEAGPDLKHAIDWGTSVDGSRLGTAFDAALQVAIGAAPFEDLPDGARFRATRDASDAGSHAFAVDADAVRAALDERLSGSEEMRTGYDWATLVDAGDGTTRSRVVYDGFDADGVAALLDGSLDLDPGDGETADGETADGETSGQTVVALADGAADRESIGGLDSVDLDLGMNRTADGEAANVVGLDFGDPDLVTDLVPGLEAGLVDAEITGAYLVFHAKWPGENDGSLRIALADDGEDDGGDGAEAVSWDDLGTWTPGAVYRSPDLAPLVARALAEGEDLAFEITGTGRHIVHSSESDGLAPQLVIDWDLA